MKVSIATPLSIVAILIALAAMFMATSGPAGQSAGATGDTNQVSTITNPYKFNKSVTLNSSLIQATSNTATTTAKFGCIQTTATSTATPIKLRFYASTSPSLLAGDTGPANFYVVGTYGNCP